MKTWICQCGHVWTVNAGGVCRRVFQATFHKYQNIVPLCWSTHLLISNMITDCADSLRCYLAEHLLLCLYDDSCLRFMYSCQHDGCSPLPYFKDPFTMFIIFASSDVLEAKLQFVSCRSEWILQYISQYSNLKERNLLITTQWGDMMTWKL